MSKENKAFDALSIEPFLGKIVRIQFRGDDHRPTSGKIVEINSTFLRIQHRDGRTSLALLDEISAIAELRV